MLIIAYPRDAGFFERAPFEYELDPKMAQIDELLNDDRLILQASLSRSKFQSRGMVGASISRTQP
jgi:hypothetical protein